MSKKEKRLTYSALTGFHRAVPIILISLALFLGLCLFIEMGLLGKALSELLRGLLSYGAYALPPLMLIQALFYPSDVGAKRVGSRIVFSLLTVISVSCMQYAITYFGQETVFSLKNFYSEGKGLVGGGAIGGMISYGLSALVSNVGVIIIAAAVVALYLSYFFSGGAHSAKALGFAIFKGIISFFALIERGIKRLIRSAKNRKLSKKNKLEERKNIELSQDEFFAVDNGLQALEISELGIKETKDGDTLEQRPTLHEKVFPKSAISSDDLSEREYDREDDEDAPSSEENEPRRRVVYTEAFSVYGDLKDNTEQVKPRTAEPIIIEQTAFDREKPHTEEAPVRDEAQSAPEAKRDSEESADGVFGKDFDPFSMMMSQKLANKPSSKGAAERPIAVTEDISELTEEELERARRIRAFEQRKKIIVDMHNAKEATPVTNRGEFTGKAKSIDFHQTVQEVVSSPKEDGEISVTIEKADRGEGTPSPVKLSFTEQDFGADRQYTAEPKVYSFDMPSEEPREGKPACAPSAEKRPNPFGRVVDLQNSRSKEGVVRDSSTPVGPSSYTRAAEFAANASRQGATDTEQKNVSYSAYKPEGYSVNEPVYHPKAEPVYSTEEQTPKQGGLVFELGEDSIKERGRTITVQRTPLRDGNSGEPFKLQPDDGLDEELEDELEDEIDDELDEDEDFELEEDFEQEEIPPEKQNPVVKSYRDMFPDLRDSDEDDRESIEEKPTERKESRVEDDEDAEDEDEVPFDGYSRAEEDELSDLIEEIEDAPPIKRKADYSNYRTPPLELLGLSAGQDDEEISAEIRENTQILIETLASFNVTAFIKGVDRGPRITRYEVVPAKGVKVNAITHLFDDISLNLAAEGIRMEAPIPGKSAIGFEIPNKRPTDVRLRELLECEEFVSSKSNTFVCIGKDVAGKPVFGDIAKFPHALVAGATGMGKSVCINSIMISILYKARPDQVKFIMIDPKKVEFKLYSGIPHLLIPVITESKQAAGALMWAVEEMERRYDLIEKHSLRNIEGYNEKVALDPSLGEPLPKIVIVIDELNDLMMQVRDPVEDLIMRIAQKARAAGIHLIIGTQRPDVKVITGTIKANIGTRISCKVTSVVDSRTILEMAGAEKLLNKGDMLFKPTDKTKPIRVQGAFVTDGEAEAVMSFLRSEVSGDQYDDDIFKEINKAAQKCGNKKGSSVAADDDMDDSETLGCYNDQQFLDAVELAIRSRKVSTSLLQRKLSIGYGKAAKYIDTMMEIGIVSEPNGQKPRDVLITLDEWQDKLARVSLD